MKKYKMAVATNVKDLEELLDMYDIEGWDVVNFAIQETQQHTFFYALLRRRDEEYE